jgi:hypothetical protein
VGKSEGKSPLGRTRRKWLENIKMDPGEIGCGGTDWTGLAQNESDNEPSGSIKCW